MFVDLKCGICVLLPRHSIYVSRFYQVLLETSRTLTSIWKSWSIQDHQYNDITTIKLEQHRQKYLIYAEVLPSKDKIMAKGLIMQGSLYRQINFDLDFYKEARAIA